MAFNLRIDVTEVASCVITSFHDLLTRAFDEGASSNNIVQMGLAHQTHIAQPSATVT
jgi:hypothetical protein